MAKQFGKKRTAKTAAALINNVWIKLYAEQCGADCDDKGVTILSFDSQKAVINERLAHIGDHLPDCWYYHAICHYKDTYTEVDAKKLSAESFFVPACEKPHAHILLFSHTKDTAGHFSRSRLGTVLQWLADVGIKFRPEYDLNIMLDFEYLDRKNHGICAAIKYHKHETIAARDADGKELYSADDCYTNIPGDLLTRFDTEYHVHYELKTPQLPTKAREIKEQAYQKAFDCGYAFGSFDIFWNSISKQFGNTVTRSKVFEGYNSGVLCSCSDKLGETFPTCAIFISSPAGSGKSVCVRRALERIFKPFEIYSASDNTGAFDRLQPSHKAIIFDDYNTKLDILKLVDTGTYDKYLYRRGSNNPLCLCKYFIFTHNDSFGEYFEKIYNTLYNDNNIWDALKSRFYYAVVNVQKSYDVDKTFLPTVVKIYDNFKATRGHGVFASERDKMYKLFMSYFKDELINFNNFDFLSEFEDF